MVQTLNNLLLDCHPETPRVKGGGLRISFMANLSFYTVIARPQRGRSNPVFCWLSGLLRQDYVLPRNDENRRFSSAVENLSGGKMANSKNRFFAKSVLNNKYKLRDLWVKDLSPRSQDDGPKNMMGLRSQFRLNQKFLFARCHPWARKGLFFLEKTKHFLPKDDT
jgi:hypothetical protein